MTSLVAVSTYVPTTVPIESLPDEPALSRGREEGVRYVVRAKTMPAANRYPVDPMRWGAGGAGGRAPGMAAGASAGRCRPRGLD